MAPNPSQNPLAPFTKDYFLTAKGGEILKRLAAVYQVLSKQDQPDDGSPPAGIDAVSAGITQSIEIRLSKDSEVCMMVCCVAAELFRLCAPDPPFENPVILAMFRLMSEHLSVLGNMEQEAAGLRTQAVAVLTSLATVRSPLILVMMMSDEQLDQTTRTRSEAVLLSLWDALIGSMRPGTPKVVEEHVLSLLAATLEDMDSLPPRFADRLLAWLLAAQTQPRSAAVAAEALKRSSDRLASPIAAYLQSVLHGKSPVGEEDGDEEELGAKDKAALAVRIKDRVAALHAVMALAPCLPSALDTLIPVLANDLGRDDLPVRLGATETLGRLFAAPPVPCPPGLVVAGAVGGKVPLGKIHNASFVLWLNRFVDMEPTIRTLMCQMGGLIMREHASLADAVSARLEARISTEPEEDTRLAAVRSANDVLVWSLRHAPARLVHTVAGRCKDKSMAIRKEAATGLAQAYGTHMPLIWRRQEEWAAANPLPEAPQRARSAGSKASAGHEAPALQAVAAPVPGSVPVLLLSPADQDTWDKLYSIPGHILGLYASRDEPALRQLSVQLVDAILLPDKTAAAAGADGAGEELEEAVRARGLACLYSSLDPRARRVFVDMQRDRRATQQFVGRMVQLRAELQKHKAASMGAGATQASPAQAAVEERLERVYVSLVDLVGRIAPDKEVAALRRLVTGVPDGAIFRLLTSLMDPTLPVKRAKLVREDLLQRVGVAAAGLAAPPAASKKGKGSNASHDPAGEAKALKDVVRYVVKKGMAVTCTPGMVPALVSVAREAVAQGQVDRAVSTVGLLVELAGVFPSLLGVAWPKAAAAAASAKGGKKAADSQAEDMDTDGPGGDAQREGHLSACLGHTVGLASCTFNGSAPLVEASLDLWARLGHGVPPTATSPSFACLSKAAQTDLRRLLLHLATTAPPRLAKRAVYVATAVLPTGDASYRFGSRLQDEAEHHVGPSEGADAWFTDLAEAVTSTASLTTSNGHLPAVLAAVGALALRAPAAFATMDSAKAGARAGSKRVPSLSSWLADHVQADPEDDPTPTEGEAAALARAGSARPTGAGAASAASAGLRGSSSAAPEDEDGGAEEDDIEDDGFVRTKAGTKRKAGASSVLSAGVPAKRGVGPSASATSEAHGTYKGLTPSFGYLTRAVALRALGCVVRGLGVKSLQLAERASALGIGSPAGGSTTPPYADLARTSADSAKGVMDGLVKLGTAVLEAGGDLANPRGRQVMQAGGSGAMASASRPSPGRGSVAGASSAVSSPGLPGRGKKSGTAITAQEDMDSACLRTAAACTLLRAVCDVPALDRYVGTPLWLDICYCCMDSVPGARKAVTSCLAKVMSRNTTLSPRWMAGLCLSGCLPDGPVDKDSRALAREALLKASLAGLKDAHARLKAAGEDDRARRAAYVRRPEACLPFALYLLSHDTPRLASESSFRDLAKAVKAAQAAAGSGSLMAGEPGAVAKKTGLVREHAGALSLLVDVVVEATRTSTGSAEGVTGCLSLLNSLYHRLDGFEDNTTDGQDAARTNVAFEGLRGLLFYCIKARSTSSKAFDRHPAESMLPVPGNLYGPKGQGQGQGASRGK